MIDVVLLLDARGFKGRIVALSRRGLLPRPHAPGNDWQKLAERPATSASKLLQAVRVRGEEIGWRNAVDELRPFTQAMWGMPARTSAAGSSATSAPGGTCTATAWRRRSMPG